MPIEIKEIIIRATIGDAGVTPASPGNATPLPGGAVPGADALQECIEQVFQILDDKKER